MVRPWTLMVAQGKGSCKHAVHDSVCTRSSGTRAAGKFAKGDRRHL